MFGTAEMDITVISILNVLCFYSEKRKGKGLFNKHFPFSCFSNSFFPGVLCGHRGAAVHSLPQRSSVLQTLLPSGATCRYGKKNHTQRGETAFCAVFFLKVARMFSCDADLAELSTSHWRERASEREREDSKTPCALSVAPSHSVRFNLHVSGKRTTMNLIRSLSGGGFSSVELAALQKYLPRQL